MYTLLVCLFVFNKRLNRGTDRVQLFVGPQTLWMIEFLKNLHPTVFDF